MPGKRRSRGGCSRCPPARRAGLRSRAGSRSCEGKDDVSLPHHIMLEILSYLDARAIVRARGVARAFARDAPKLVDFLRFSSGDKFPAATQMSLFKRVTEVHIYDGEGTLVKDATAGLPGCVSLRRLCISRCLPQQNPLSGGAVVSLCALQLSDLDVCRVRMDVPRGLPMPAWLTLSRLVLRDAFLCDQSLANLAGSLPQGVRLPLRELDLSRNPFGDMQGMRPLSDALSSFPDLKSLELTADRISSVGATSLLGALLDGACPKLTSLDMSLNFLGDSVLEFLAHRVRREGHGLMALERMGIGGRFTSTEGVTTFKSLANALAAGGLPLLTFLHVQGDVGPPQVGPMLREFKQGACPKLAVVKVERSTRFHPADDRASVEDAVESMLELVTCAYMPRLREVHVLGMNLGKGLEWAEEERTAFYRARNKSSFHRLALAGANRGVMVFV